MALLLDTSVLEPDQRADAFVDAMGRASVPCAIHLENPERVSARMNVWNLGAASLFRSESTGMRLTRTPRHVRSASMPVLAIALQESGIGHLDQHDEQRRVPAGELLMTDLTSTYDFSWPGTGASQCLYVPMDRLGLPIDTVRDAATRPHHSNLYPVMIAHVRELFRIAALLETDPAAEQLGEASIELARALVTSIAHANPDASAPRSALAMTSIRRYIREHLHDPTLNPRTNCSRPQHLTATAVQDLLGQRLSDRTVDHHPAPAEGSGRTGSTRYRRSADRDRCAPGGVCRRRTLQPTLSTGLRAEPDSLASAPRLKQRHNVRLTTTFGIVQRGLPRCIPDRGICPRVEKLSDHVDIARRTIAVHNGFE